LKPFQLVFRYARKYTGVLVVTIISMFLLVGVQLVIPWIIKVLIGAITDQMAASKTMSFITSLTLAMFGIYVLRAILTFLRGYLAHVAGWGVVAEVRGHIYNHLQRLSLRYYADKQTGQLMSRVVNDTDLFEQLIAHAVPDVLVNVLTLVGVSIVLFSLNWRLTLLSIVPIPLVILSLRVYARYVRPAFRDRQNELGDLNALLNDNISGIREIKAFTREHEENQRVGVGIDRYRRSLLRALRLMSIFQPFVDFTSSLGLLIVIYFGGQLAFKGILSVADLVAFFLYLDLFYQPVRNLGNSWEQVQGALAGADRVAEIMAEEPEIQDEVGATKIPGRAKGDITFSNVNFHYNEGENIPAKYQPGHSGQPCNGFGRPDRGREIDAGQPDPAVLRRVQRADIYWMAKISAN
jgi:ATP-binding cassette subfamily B protein